MKVMYCTVVVLAHSEVSWEEHRSFDTIRFDLSRFDFDAAGAALERTAKRILLFVCHRGS